MDISPYMFEHNQVAEWESKSFLTFIHIRGQAQGRQLKYLLCLHSVPGKTTLLNDILGLNRWGTCLGTVVS